MLFVVVVVVVVVILTCKQVRVQQICVLFNITHTHARFVFIELLLDSVVYNYFLKVPKHVALVTTI